MVHQPIEKCFECMGNICRANPTNPVYKTTNRYSEEERPVFFVSDVPHLLKTTRNNWSHSFSHGCTRTLWVGYNVYQCIMVCLSTDKRGEALLSMAYLCLYCNTPFYVRGNSISWKHLQQLYDAKSAMSTISSGLYLIQKLKQEHINLTSFSWMRVDLAAQVRTCMRV